MTERGTSIDGYGPADIITTDVVVLGGGGSGTYGAIRLTDLGKSVIVVDHHDYLGGHTYTYTDPASGNNTEMGVVAWYDIPVVQNFFKRLGVKLQQTDIARAGTTTLTTIPVDFRTGKTLTSVYSGNVTQGLINYVEQISKYPYLEDSFDLPDTIPEDFLIPFGDFVKKYNIEGAVQILNIFGNGMGNFLDQSTLYVFKLVSLASIQALQENSYQATVSHNNRAPYEAAEKILGKKALLSTTILSVDRSSPLGVKVQVLTPTGKKLIIAKKLLSSIPPKLENLLGWDLDLNERVIFSEFLNAGYYSAIIKNTGIPDGIEVRNFGADTPYNVPFLPGPYFVQSTDTKGLFTVKYCTPAPIGDDNAKSAIIAAVQRLKTAGTLNTTTPEFVIFHSHSPFESTVSVEAIKSGFYKKLYALQGGKKTFWTGAAWHAQDSSKLWQFTEKLLPDIVKGL
ncbi:flavin-containing superfamily amine oxidase-like protein [Mytilinidion resinicola]|uniref:Flavin-containing superfamily amine oxidase-like protein n=1 Tax=Mytilinidion resinicola TaxID=574789 RepID=A0A6A6YH86_9PEZI|nr:flavin-containing superfamily amine oxidase-like protein [Mytilinidion resinicola]KAF2807364.1 flavin-containing superfamily amine oxidase-like protein [Mytilinidion resinicola]